MKTIKKEVVIVGSGFAGLNAAKRLGNKKNVHVTVIDKNNYHLFQPLLYQVATAELSATEIASPIRSLLSDYKNIDVIFDKVVSIDKEKKYVKTKNFSYSFDFLILACGSTHSYFGKNQWKNFAPGMKSVEDALLIRNKILLAFEQAERSTDPQEINSLLTFVVVGGGPTGVEIAGSIAEMSKYTLSKDFRRIDVKKTKIILLEAGSRILSSFSEKYSQFVIKHLQKLGVTINLSSPVTNITNEGVFLENAFIPAANVIWAAGVKPSATGQMLGTEMDAAGRVKVRTTLQIKEKDHIFVLGDQAYVEGAQKKPLPGLGAVALQEGIHASKNILRAISGQQLLHFHYKDKGQMATIGRGFAIAEIKKFKIKGYFAWLLWLFVHIVYLIGFRNKVLILIRWAWFYLSYTRGARLLTQSLEE